MPFPDLYQAHASAALSKRTRPNGDLMHIKRMQSMAADTDCHKPTLKRSRMYQRILVPDDGSPTARKALDSAIALAKESNGQIRLFHLLEELPYLGYELYGNYNAELMESLRTASNTILADGMAHIESAGVSADTVLVDKFGELLGDATAKAAAEWGADLIVVGTHGRRGVGRLFLGSGAEQIIRLAPVPVLVVRGEAPTPAAKG
jgi:nucleotide-binding universal stress UspA family protein